MASTPLAAALAAGRAAGLVVDEPVVLRDLTNLVVRLAPAPVVARVPLTFTRLRGREWLEAELRLVGELRDVGLPVTGPARGVRPVLSEHDGYLVSLWELVPEDAHAALDAHAAGSALRRLHDELADVDRRGSSTSPGSTSGATSATLSTRRPRPSPAWTRRCSPCTATRISAT